ncbi:hypothetical protein Poly41_08380 [Novipirellula artificiosorum]|uniref:Uncharacterized protein n=1 Tax=Novipirellula artificiosorum TaxID=2528016 RepID=A0A5C6E4N2_9BACT|nr:hypothetical protein Poly41_08380 [Novipirellula artificiosorum]
MRTSTERGKVLVYYDCIDHFGQECYRNSIFWCFQRQGEPLGIVEIHRESISGEAGVEAFPCRNGCGRLPSPTSRSDLADHFPRACHCTLGRRAI